MIGSRDPENGERAVARIRAGIPNARISYGQLELTNVNHFHAAGGMSYFISELISAGLVHTDVTTVAGGDGLLQYGLEPFQNETTGDDSIVYRDGA